MQGILLKKPVAKELRGLLMKLRVPDKSNPCVPVDDKTV